MLLHQMFPQVQLHLWGLLRCYLHLEDLWHLWHPSVRWDPQPWMPRLWHLLVQCLLVRL